MTSDSPISDTTRHMIDQLLAHGLQRGHSYKIEFAFFGNASGLTQARDQLLAQGYEQDTTQTQEMLVVARHLPLDYDSIGTALAKMKRLAEEYRITFDGWSADAHQ